MTPSKELAREIVELIDERKEFGPLEDGYIYYFPKGGGGIAAHELRIIADELDKRNAELDKTIRNMEV